ncbi:hypothetical protein [Legionella spiritensis]|uniref:Uncharacterized protein n=1 Tax=Legionella spiritensis TaxID=452 RepID=A0A0W0YXV6_LEGSP|nr:hypothetical protein [Legionella spiritensis]KTD61725.1 hypothetical protein Lspi_2355 [Legionella spiritensis]SNV38747.1 Uncharacterised protein [Legionella spiritensis]
MFKRLATTRNSSNFFARSFATSNSPRPPFQVRVPISTNSEIFAAIRSNEEDASKLKQLGDTLKAQHYEVHHRDGELFVAQTREKLLHDIDQAASEVEHQPAGQYKP